MKNKKPLVTIITVCYNAEMFITETIKSVINQNERIYLEYIIVDGKSTDNTMKIVRSFQENIDIIISENDNGIYDAMNKGLNLANGTYVLFLNAGDYLSHRDNISLIKQKGTNVDIFYSDTLLVTKENKILGRRSEITTRKLPLELTKDSFKNGLIVSHQSFIPKKEIAPLFIENNLSADIDWIINCTDRASSTYCLSRPISCFLIGGISDQNKLESLKDRFKVMKHHFGLFQTTFLHLYFIFRFIFKKINISI